MEYIKNTKSKSNGMVNASSQITHENNAMYHLDNRNNFSIQRKENNTGLPDNLKSGIENLSGYAMDDVKVHYNSDEPAKLSAHAYAQGTNIHLASGQEKHLPHEAWHVVQQKQGRVKPTLQLKAGVQINDDEHLEREASTMSDKASGKMDADLKNRDVKQENLISQKNPSIIQRAKFSSFQPLNWGFIRNIDVNGLKMDTILQLAEVIPDDMDDGLGRMMEYQVNFWRGGPKFVQLSLPELAEVHRKANEYNLFLNRKVEENPTILAFPGNLRSRYQRLSIKSVRKVNRISGLLKAKNLMPQTDRITSALDDYVIRGRDPSEVIQNLFEENNFPDLSLKRLEFLKLLLAAARNIPSINATNYESTVRNLELQIEQNEFLKVIAHRGDGATFDKMGGVLPRSEHDYIYRHENENSEESTRKAMTTWGSGFSRLSGIECDVFLTQDNVPIVTHTAFLDALLQQELRNPFFRSFFNSDIRQTFAHLINPRFMTLQNWLSLIEHYVNERAIQLQNFNISLNKKLRIEIEMKQVGVLTDTNQSENWRYVEKVVSRFLKNSRYSHLMEIALFNNSNVPVLRFRNAKQKTMMSHVTYGKGGNPDPELLEVRFGMHQKGIANLIQNGALDEKIVTFAPGLDHPGDFFSVNKQLLPVNRLSNTLNVTIEQSIQSARHRRLIELMKQRKDANPNQGPVSIHTLTDHGETGASNILRSGLFVGKPETIPNQWNTEEIRQMHPELTDAQIREALNRAITENNPKLIGEILIDKVPQLL